MISQPQGPKTLNLIGPGQVGQPITTLLQEQALISLQGVYSRTGSRAQAFTRSLEAGEAVASLNDLTPADITLITTPDDAIQSTCEALAKLGLFASGQIVFHMSGAQSSSILQSAAEQGAAIASAHPLKSFISLATSIETFPGTFCTFEGSSEALTTLIPWFEAIGARCQVINPADKILYHAAAVMTCGGLTALFGAGASLLRDIGFPEDEARALLGQFMGSTLANNVEQGAAEALTGPVKRRDEETIALHQAVLSDYSLDYAELYRKLTDSQRNLASGV